MNQSELAENVASILKERIERKIFPERTGKSSCVLDQVINDSGEFVWAFMTLANLGALARTPGFREAIDICSGNIGNVFANISRTVVVNNACFCMENFQQEVLAGRTMHEMIANGVDEEEIFEAYKALLAKHRESVWIVDFACEFYECESPFAREAEAELFILEQIRSTKIHDMESGDGWPRSITIRPTFETAQRMLNREDDDGSDSFLFAWGTLYESLAVSSWKDVELPVGFEIASDREREKYAEYHERLTDDDSYTGDE